MQQRTGFALRPAIAALTLAASSIAITPASHAAPEATCLNAPKGAAPKGQHWYYRLERPPMRKCWYLADRGRAVAQRAAARSAPPDEAEDDEANMPATVASVPAGLAANAPAGLAANAPATNAAATSVASAPPPPAAEPTPVITTLTTRNVSNEMQPSATNSAQPPLAANSASPTTVPVTEAVQAEPVSTLAERFPSDQPAPALVAEQTPTAAAARQLASVSAEPMSTLQLLLGAVALLGFFASAVFLGTALLRRRNDVFNARRETDALPFEESPEIAAEEGTRFEPLRALDSIRQHDLDPMRQHDDVDEILQRLARRRRAA